MYFKTKMVQFECFEVVCYDTMIKMGLRRFLHHFSLSISWQNCCNVNVMHYITKLEDGI